MKTKPCSRFNKDWSSIAISHNRSIIGFFHKRLFLTRQIPKLVNNIAIQFGGSV